MLGMALISATFLTLLATKYSVMVGRMTQESREIQETLNLLTVNFSSLSKNYETTLATQDKLITMLGTKGPLEFQAVQAMQTDNAYGKLEYVDPSDEAEVRRLNDLIRSGTNTAQQDDELSSERIPDEWNDWDDPGYVAKSITEGPS